MKRILILVTALIGMSAFGTTSGNFEALRIQVGTIEGVNFRRDCRVQVCTNKHGEVTFKIVESKLRFHNDAVVKTDTTGLGTETARSVASLVSIVEGIDAPKFPSNNRLLKNYWIKDMGSGDRRLLSTSIREVGKAPLFLFDQTVEGLALRELIDDICR